MQINGPFVDTAEPVDATVRIRISEPYTSYNIIGDVIGALDPETDFSHDEFRASTSNQSR